MSILVDESTRLLVQGITGREGQFHTQQMLHYGTTVVAGATPGRGGGELAGVPIFDTVKDAVAATHPNASIVFVPANVGGADPIYEATDHGIPLVVCISEGIPVLDMVRCFHYLRLNGTRLIGPNCPGLISPGKAKVGIMAGHIHRPGSIGIVSRSGTLTYEIVNELTNRGYGQSTAIGIGGDPIIGTSFVDVLALFKDDLQTEAIVLIGEIGGTDEQQAASYIEREVRKPVVAFIAGRTAPPGRRMGHAGAIISGGTGTAAEKMAALRAAGVHVAETPAEVGDLIESLGVSRATSPPASS
ncbi:MAG: succinate--CoA ligase subunit alpha [Chloroflexi bacterium]|nr:succinate--CoA ligase subunit alpha [Chloroflexota bacterium]